MLGQQLFAEATSRYGIEPGKLGGPSEGYTKPAIPITGGVFMAALPR